MIMRRLFSPIFCLVTVILCLFPLSGSATADVIYQYDFEAGWASLSADNGVWEVGTPTSGPNGCHSGSQCAATILNGNYPADTDSRLISPSINLPALAGGEEIHLRFWQWFSYAASDGGQVQISVYDNVAGTWSTWANIGNSIVDNSSWSVMDIDLTAYAAKKVRIAFYHTASSWPWGECSTGWYIDDIQVIKKVPEFTGSFEAGWGDWSADRGVWQVGTPTVGPKGCYGGAECVATGLDGNYPADTDSRLISPSINLPAITGGEEIHLRFWQWFSYAASDGGQVQISVYDNVAGIWSAWVNIGNSIVDNSLWSPKDIDLTVYAGKEVRIAFYHTASSWPWGECSTGWYIDDITITPPPIPPVLTAHTLTILSSNPISGVSITIIPNDNSAQGNGTTQFTRTYNNGTSVTLTAPSTAGANNFSSWDGCDSASGTTCNVTMSSDRTVTVNYAMSPPPSNYIFFDDFESYTTGAFPSSGGWQLRYNGTGSSSQYVDNTHFVSGSKALHLVGSSCWASQAYHSVPILDQVVLEGDVFVNQIVSCGCSPLLAGIRFMNPTIGTWGTTFGEVSFNCDGNIYADKSNGGSDAVLLMPYVAGKWYHIKLTADLIARSFNVYIDDVLKQTGLQILESGMPTGIEVYAGHGGNPTVWFDDVKVASLQGTQQYTLTVGKAGTGSGTVTSNPAGINCSNSCSSSFSSGAQVTLTATADSGSAFSSWSGCDSASGTTCNVTMNSDRTVTVNYGIPPPPSNILKSYDVQGKETIKVSIKRHKSQTVKTAFSDTFTFYDDGNFEMTDMGGAWSQKKNKFTIYLDPESVGEYFADNLSEQLDADVSVQVTKITFTGTEQKNGNVKGNFTFSMTFYISDYDLSGKIAVSGNFKGTPSAEFSRFSSDEKESSQSDSILDVMKEEVSNAIRTD